jgi:hypothetical protein
MIRLDHFRQDKTRLSELRQEKTRCVTLSKFFSVGFFVCLFVLLMLLLLFFFLTHTTCKSMQTKIHDYKHYIHTPNIQDNTHNNTSNTHTHTHTHNDVKQNAYLFSSRQTAHETKKTKELTL